MPPGDGEDALQVSALMAALATFDHLLKFRSEIPGFRVVTADFGMNTIGSRLPRLFIHSVVRISLWRCPGRKLKKLFGYWYRYHSFSIQVKSFSLTC
jgi:hypothetical protein